MRFSSIGFGPAAASKEQGVRARPRVLIADHDRALARRLAEFFLAQGIESRLAVSVSEAKEIVDYWKPSAIFVELTLPDTNALSLCRFVQSRARGHAMPQIIVMSKHQQPQGFATLRQAGASHYLVKPFSLEEAVRLLRPLEPEDQSWASGAREATIKELHLLNLFLQQASLGPAGPEKLYNLMRMISLKVHALRGSLIRCLDEDNGLVLASNDDETVKGLPLKLAQYPEVREVRRTLKPLLIPQVASSDLLAPVRSTLQQTPFAAIALFPVFCRGEFFGVLSLRMEQKARPEFHYIEKFGQVCSQILSLALGQ